MKQMRGLAVVAGLFVLVLAAATMPRSVLNAWASGVTYQLIGDTLSFRGSVYGHGLYIRPASGTYHDTTYKGPNDCCLYTPRSLADTTRPLLVLGASNVTVKVLACDTCFSAAIHVTSVQFSDDSTYWQGAAVGAEDPVFGVYVDTLGGVTLGALSATPGAQMTRAGSGGGQRDIKITPTKTMTAASRYPVTAGRIRSKWARIITATTPNVDGNGAQMSPFQVRMRGYVERDDIGEAWLTKVMGTDSVQVGIPR